MKIFYYLSRPFAFLSKAIRKMNQRLFLFPSFKSCGKKVSVGKNFICTPKRLSIGNHTAIGPNCVFYCSMADLKIGSYVMISPNVTIITGSHKADVIGKNMIEVSEQEKIESGIEKYDKEVVIEDDVWIGANVLILKGVTIGRGSIIHSGQVIEKSIKPYTVYINEKIQIKRFSEEEIVEHEKILKERGLLENE